MADSLPERAKRLEMGLLGSLAGFDVYEQEKPVQKLMNGLKRELIDMRLDIRDYEFADTLAGQQKAAKAALRRLDRVRKQVLSLSEYGLIGAADVAESSAHLEDVAKGL